MASFRKARSRVGVIGLGIIGSRVAANLRAAGHQVYVWSRSPHSSPNFLGSVVEVADLCDVIQIFVSNDAALLEMIRTTAAALAPRHIVCAHPTISPAAARQAASIVESQGARYLDAPFTGSKAAAQNKQLVYYVGGDEKTLEAVQPVLSATSKQVVYVGRVGDASVLKIATNMLTANTVQTLAEALALVRAAGIDGQRLMDALEHNGSQSGTSAMKLPAMLAQDFEPNFSLKHMCKDLRLALDLAAKYKVTMPATAMTAGVFGESLTKGWGDEDFAVVARNYPLPRLAPSGSSPEAAAPAAGTSAAGGTAGGTAPAASVAPAPTSGGVSAPSVAPGPGAAPGPGSSPIINGAPAATSAPGKTPTPSGAPAAVAAPATTAEMPATAQTVTQNGAAATTPAVAPPPAPEQLSAPDNLAAKPPGPAPILGGSEAALPRRSTMRIIRNFFKPEPAKRP